MKILEYTKKWNIEFNPMERYSKKQLQWITVGLMFGSCFLGVLSYQLNDGFTLSIGWLMAFISGQFYFICVNWDDLEKSE